MNERRLGLRIVMLLFGLVLLFSVISWRLVFLQVTCHDRYSSEVERKHVNLEVLPALRGSVMDRNGELLAADKPVRSVVVDLRRLTHLRYAQEAIAEFEGISEGEVKQRYSVQEQLRSYVAYVADRLSEPLGRSSAEILQRMIAPSKGGVRPDMNGEVVLATGLNEEVGEQ